MSEPISRLWFHIATLANARRLSHSMTSSYPHSRRYSCVSDLSAADESACKNACQIHQS
ncbi:hypothetical protein RB61 [Rhodopirellula baltica SH 1]|uniref:Uncharacterized protein n=1 Tax=Rhodopirellula baltica (strain DSM 10527 / NCIMB 13988 / SH1) TaxID=243090 RepID=Q7UZB8_RHOBA|nr:hypothetical protein RB61 [Rhodopirellula baltica SH 1]